jgi:hypothetical protein
MESQVKVFTDHGEFIKALSTGGVVGVSQELFDHFLNVLPPVSMGPGRFTFGEGSDRITFWKGSDHCWARIESTMLFSEDWSRWVVAKFQPAELAHAAYCVTESSGIEGVIGKQFPTLVAMAHELDLVVR